MTEPAGPAGAVPAGAPDGPARGGEPAEVEFAVVATVRLASAGLHVIDRWTDALLDALQDAGAAEPQVGGSLTGGRIEVSLTVDATGAGAAGAVAAGLLRTALDAAATTGVRVVGLATDVRPAAPPPG